MAESNTNSSLDVHPGYASCYIEPYDGYALRVGRTASLAVTMCILIIGNLLVITIFKRKATTRNNTNYFIVNTAASELFLVFPWPLRTIHIWFGGEAFLVGGPVGEFLCKLVMFYSDISPAVAIQSLILMTVERFIVIMHPLKSKRFTPRLRTILIILTWIVAGLLHVPYFYFLRLESKCGASHYCIRDWTPVFDSKTTDKIYFLTVVAVFIYIPLIVVTVLYTLLYLELRKIDAPGSRLQDMGVDVRRHAHNKRIAKMSICYVIVFAVCWLPLSAFWLAVHFSQLYLNYTFELAVFHLALSNSAINPLIIFYFNRNFRQGFKDLFGCCRIHRSNPNIASSAVELEETNRNEDVQEITP